MRFLATLYLASLQCYCLTKSPYASLQSFRRHSIPKRPDLALQSKASDLIPTSQLVQSFFDICRENSPFTEDKQLESCRSKGRELLFAKIIPTSKHEAWRHTNLRNLFVQPITVATLNLSNQQTTSHPSIDEMVSEDCLQSHITFIDGRYASHLSDTSSLSSTITIGAYSQLVNSFDLETNSALINDFLTVQDSSEKLKDSFASDTLTALNLMNLHDAIIVKIPKGIKASHPLHIIFYSTKTPNSGSFEASFPRVHILAEAESTIEIRQTYTSAPVSSSYRNDNSSIKSQLSLMEVDDDGSYQFKSDFGELLTEGGIPAVGTVNTQPESASSSEQVQAAVGGAFMGAVTQVFLMQNATVTHILSQELSSTGRHVEVLTADLANNSRYSLTSLQLGGANTRLNAHLRVGGSGANCTVSGIILCEEGQSTDIHSSITHDAPASESKQQQRIIVADRAQAVFKGRIRIPEQAQETESDQLCRSIMLGDRARVIAMPTLEITADNIVCSHGASIADVDPNAMFYITSRGLSPVIARKMLLKAFVLEMLRSISDRGLIDRISDKVERMSPNVESYGNSNGSQSNAYVSM